MSLLAASDAAYNKELSLISHFILHLGFDPGYAKLGEPYCRSEIHTFEFFFFFSQSQLMKMYASHLVGSFISLKSYKVVVWSWHD